MGVIKTEKRERKIKKFENSVKISKN